MCYTDRRSKEEKTMSRKMVAAGCILWIAGLAAFIIGLNITGGTGQWLTIAGSAAFLVGLLIVGADRLMKMKEEAKQKDSDS